VTFNSANKFAHGHADKLDRQPTVRDGRPPGARGRTSRRPSTTNRDLLPGTPAPNRTGPPPAGIGHGRARTGPRTGAEKATDGAGGSGYNSAILNK
jgi:hypothetical protein